MNNQYDDLQFIYDMTWYIILSSPIDFYFLYFIDKNFSEFNINRDFLILNKNFLHVFSLQVFIIYFSGIRS